MASFVCVPARCLHHIPDELTFERAALTEPCCVAYNAVSSKSTVRPGDTVLVIGPGPICLLCPEMARLAGARNLIVAGTAQDASRLDLARLLGATHTVDVQNTNFVEYMREIGDGLGADLVIDAAGVSAALKTAPEIFRPRSEEHTAELQSPRHLVFRLLL